MNLYNVKKKSFSSSTWVVSYFKAIVIPSLKRPVAKTLSPGPACRRHPCSWLFPAHPSRHSPASPSFPFLPQQHCQADWPKSVF